MSESASASAPIDLAEVRRLFSRTERVAGADFLRREIAARMHERLALVKLEPRHVLDAGCGAGADLGLLKARYPQAQLLGIDASAALLAHAAGPQTGGLKGLLSRLAPRGNGPLLACADFASLPLAAGALDLVWSSLALHWHPQPDRVFAEWRRALRVQGLLMFSCFGPDTLRELRGAFAAAGLAPPVLPFVDMHDFGDMLVGAGFATPVMDMETITVTYGSAEKLLADVRALGGNPLATRARGLTGKRAWRAMLAALEARRGADGTIPLTFEVIYGHAFRPQPRTTAAGESIVRFDPSARRRDG
jgi:malonyl-CoA O-methyltransferase